MKNMRLYFSNQYYEDYDSEDFKKKPNKSGLKELIAKLPQQNYNRACDS